MKLAAPDPCKDKVGGLSLLTAPYESNGKQTQARTVSNAVLCDKTSNMEVEVGRNHFVSLLITSGAGRNLPTADLFTSVVGSSCLHSRNVQRCFYTEVIGLDRNSAVHSFPFSLLCSNFCEVALARDGVDQYCIRCQLAPRLMPKLGGLSARLANP